MPSRNGIIYRADRALYFDAGGPPNYCHPAPPVRNPCYPRYAVQGTPHSRGIAEGSASHEESDLLAIPVSPYYAATHLQGTSSRFLRLFSCAGLYGLPDINRCFASGGPCAMHL